MSDLLLCLIMSSSSPFIRALFREIGVWYKSVIVQSERGRASFLSFVPRSNIREEKNLVEQESYTIGWRVASHEACWKNCILKRRKNWHPMKVVLALDNYNVWRLLFGKLPLSELFLFIYSCLHSSKYDALSLRQFIVLELGISECDHYPLFGLYVIWSTHFKALNNREEKLNNIIEKKIQYSSGTDENLQFNSNLWGVRIIWVTRPFLRFHRELPVHTVYLWTCLLSFWLATISAVSLNMGGRLLPGRQLC